MKQKKIFMVLFFSTTILIILFFWNTKKQKAKLVRLKNNLNEINIQLNSHGDILKETVRIENDLIHKKDTLINQFSLSKNIIEEIDLIKGLARDFKVNIEDIKVDRENTFLPSNQILNNNDLPLERHTLSFQLSGKFISIGEFLEEQNNKFGNIFLSQCEFKMDSLDPRGVIAQLEFNIYGDKK
jgi:hypothetical protein